MHYWNDIVTLANGLVSLIGIIILIYNRSIRLNIDVIDHRTYEHSCKLYVRIQNRSLLPITINFFEICYSYISDQHSCQNWDSGISGISSILCSDERTHSTS